MANTAESMTATEFAPLDIELLRVRNFRGLRDCEVELEPDLTLLVGRNNAGKSRLLRAIAIALGRLPVELDDLTVGSDTPATVDVVVAPAPAPPTPQTDEEFAEPLAQRLQGTQITREEPLRERFAWRTTIHKSAEGLGARSEMQLLIWDAANRDWILPERAASLIADQRSLFSATLVATHRDLVEELTRRGSPIRRVLSDLEVTEETRLVLESKLRALGEEIVNSSATLEAVKNALTELDRRVGGLGAPALNAIPARLEELTRSVAIDLDAGSGALPVRLHGSGARSLASLQVQGVLYDRRLGKDGPAVRPHPVTLVEEPEAHLHPQANLEVADLLTSMPGQVVASTHSSHLVTAVAPRAIRMVRIDSSEVTVVDLGPARSDNPALHRARRPTTHASEMEKLKRLVERPFGELLFASAIVIGDGATERAFLPIVLRAALGHQAHSLCVIDPGGMNSELARAAIKFAKLVDIPWLLFSDTDGPGKASAERLVSELGQGDSGRVVWIDGTGGVQLGDGAAIERILIDFDGELCRDACIEVRPDLAESDSTLDMMKKEKGSVGAALARKLIAKFPDPADWPAPLRALIERLEGLL